MIDGISGYASSINVSPLSRVQNTENASPVSPAQKRSENEQIVDELSLSVAGLELANLLEAKPEVQPTDETREINTSLRPEDSSLDSTDNNVAETDEKEDEFLEILKEKLEAAEIQTEQDIELSYDSDVNLNLVSEPEGEFRVNDPRNAMNSNALGSSDNNFASFHAASAYAANSNFASNSLQPSLQQLLAQFSLQNT